MISHAEIKKRLNATIDLQGRGPDFERTARYTVDVLTPEIRKMLLEAIEIGVKTASDLYQPRPKHKKKMLRVFSD